ncbi:HNH endonuclease [Streptomyces shenzhenensis]|uniref:HNH endonuclease n=1 Tax=Streptomyces shenzhenensis TaxID=943815 RepID=UPI0033FF568C
MAGNPRNGRRYRRLVDWLRAQRLPCWLCGHNIGYELDARHPLSFTLDHEVPLSRGGDLLDPANARSAHRRCNSARGNRTDAARQPVRSSRRW